MEININKPTKAQPIEIQIAKSSASENLDLSLVPSDNTDDFDYSVEKPNEKEDFNYSVSEKETPLDFNYSIISSIRKLSQLENDVGYITLSEVPEGMTEEQKVRLSALNVYYDNDIMPSEELDLSTIEIDKNGAEYGFYYNSETGSLCPQNSGVDESYSYGKITFDVPQDTTIQVFFRQQSEQNYDYGMLSNLDTYLTHSNYDDDYGNTKWNGQYTGSTEESVIYDVTAGEHFITFKYKKDSSVGNGDDRFEITGVRIEGYNSGRLVDYDTGEVLDLATKSYVSEATFNLATKEELNQKQDKISDLSTIRSNASKGATAVQPSTLNSYATITYVNNKIGNIETVLNNINSGA